MLILYNPYLTRDWMILIFSLFHFHPQCLPTQEKSYFFEFKISLIIHCFQNTKQIMLSTSDVKFGQFRVLCHVGHNAKDFFQIATHLNSNEGLDSIRQSHY